MMATKKKDNPAALAVMGVVLLGALVSVGRSLFAGDPQPGVRQAPASTNSSGAGVSIAAPGRLPLSERDPFSSPLLRAASVVQTGPTAAPPPTAAGPAAPTRSTPGPPVPVLTPLGSNVRLAPVPVRAAPLAGASSEEETRSVGALRVTAIVMGAHPYAVLEPGGGTPRTLHAGEEYRSLRLVAVHPGEIVLKGRFGLWTLPLATPETETAPLDTKN